MGFEHPTIREFVKKISSYLEADKLEIDYWDADTCAIGLKKR